MLDKYLALDRIDVLQKRRIRFTPPGAFNDPFEFHPVLKTLGSDPELQQQIDVEFNKVVDAELAKIGPALSRVPTAQVDLLRANARDKMLPFFRSGEFGFLRQVRHQTSRPIVSLMRSGALEWLETKADVWAYEREWRMFLVLSRAAEVKPIGATLLHLFEFPSDCVTEVILGAKCSPATEAALVSAVASFQNTPPIYRCGIDDANYKITRQKA